MAATRSGSPRCPAITIDFDNPDRCALGFDADEWFSAPPVRRWVTPERSATRRSVPDARSGIQPCTIFAPRSACRRATPASERAVGRRGITGWAACWATFPLNSATLPLEPNTKNGETVPSGVPLPTMAGEGRIWNVRLSAFARHASSKK